MTNPLFLVPVSLSFSICLIGMGLRVYLLLAVIFDSLLIWTNLTLLGHLIEDNVWLTSRFSDSCLVVPLLVALVAAVL